MSAAPALLAAPGLAPEWLGHAQLTTTAIYADAVGAEEKDIARRMWPSAR